MNKIDKTDIANIKLLTTETRLGNLSKIKIKKGDYEIELSSENLNISPSISEIAPKSYQNSIEESKIEEKVNDENIVKSPMVGVAYLSSDPKTPPYIKIGQHVKQGDTLLLIEAMKTFNEVKAPISGIVKEIKVLNSQPVEFGDDLIIFE